MYYKEKWNVHYIFQTVKTVFNTIVQEVIKP